MGSPARSYVINTLSTTGSFLENSSVEGGGELANEKETFLSVLRLCGKDLSSSKTGASWQPRRTVRKFGSDFKELVLHLTHLLLQIPDPAGIKTSLIF